MEEEGQDEGAERSKKMKKMEGGEEDYLEGVKSDGAR